MDFHTLSRRDLQSLCKKNRIPANLTNVAMADALQSLQTVEGIEEVLESLQSFSSPKKSDLVSPAPPRTSRRTSSRRVVGTANDETKGQQASPLPRARRVTVRASEVLSLVEGTEGEDGGQKKEGGLPETPMVNTRRRTGKKEGEVEATAAKKSVTTRRKATKKEETEMKKTEDSSTTVGVTTRRRATRQSSKKEEVEEVSASVGMTRRSTRGKEAVKMAALGTNEEEEEEEEEEEKKEEEKEKEEEGKETEDVNDQKNDLSSGVVVVESRKGEDRETEEDSVDQNNDLCSEEVAVAISKEVTVFKNPLEKELNSENSELVEEKISGNIQEEDQKDEVVDETLSGLQNSLILGLVSFEPTPKDENLEHDSLSAESTTEEVTKDGGLNVQELPLTGEIPAENENSRIQMHLISDDCDLTSETMEEVKESGNDDLFVDPLLNKDTAEIMADAMEITTESNETTILADEIEVEEVIENQKSPLPEPNLTVDSLNEIGQLLDNLEILVTSDQIKAETVEITVESNESTINLSYSILAGKVEVEAIENENSALPVPNITGESPIGVGELLDNVIQSSNLEIPIPSDLIKAENMEIMAESNESTNSLTSSVLLGENGVEEVFESQKLPMPETDLTEESPTGVGEELDNGIQSPNLEITSSVLLVGEIEVEEVMESQKLPLLEPDLSVEISAGNKEPLEISGEITVEREEVPMIGAGVDREENEGGNKENTEVVVAGPNGGGNKEVKLEDLSLRKLKAAFKEKLVISKNKEKRSALKVLDDNCI